MNIIPLKLSVTNCFLIQTGAQYVLVDTGYEEDWDLFRAQLKKANVSLSQISHIILTHHHDDHCGLLHKILEENSSIRVVISPLCKELILVGENDRTHGGGLINKRIYFLLHFKQFYLSTILKKTVAKEKNLMFPPYQVRTCDILAADETKLRDMGIPLDGKIIYTPGHTVDSISVLFDDGDCLIGDAAANFLRFFGTKYCVIFVCNMDEYYKSWEKVIAAGARRIYPAHGEPFSVDKLKANLWRNKAENLVHYR